MSKKWAKKDAKSKDLAYKDVSEIRPSSVIGEKLDADSTPPHAGATCSLSNPYGDKDCNCCKDGWSSHRDDRTIPQAAKTVRPVGKPRWSHKQGQTLLIPKYDNYSWFDVADTIGKATQVCIKRFHEIKPQASKLTPTKKPASALYNVSSVSVDTTDARGLGKDNITGGSWGAIIVYGVESIIVALTVMLHTRTNLVTNALLLPAVAIAL